MFGDYWTQWTDHRTRSFDVAFLDRPARAAADVLGSTLLGIALLRNGFVPRPRPGCSTVTLPLAFGILMVTSMGSAALPVMFAFGLAGRRLRVPAPVLAATAPAGRA